MKKQYTGFLVFLCVFAVISVGIYGWISNVVTVFGSNFDPLTGALVLRIVGIFVAPIGIVLGYF